MSTKKKKKMLHLLLISYRAYTSAMYFCFVTHPSAVVVNFVLFCKWMIGIYKEEYSKRRSKCLQTQTYKYSIIEYKILEQVYLASWKIGTFNNNNSKQYWVLYCILFVVMLVIYIVILIVNTSLLSVVYKTTIATRATAKTKKK